MLEADLANLNAILHPPGMVCNAGWIEATGGKFGFYAEGSGRAVVRVMDAIDHERLALAGRLGVRAVPFTELFHQDQRERDAGCRQRQNSQRGAQSLKRKISDAIFARLQADARQAAAAGAKGPGGHPGNDSASSAADSHPARQLFGQATPRPGTSLRPGTTTGTPSKPVSKKTQTTT